MNPKVSIIIACYNDPYVVEAVRSANNQTYQNKEIILIDDGSEEEVARILRGLEGEVDQLIIQSNSGQSAARNNGIRISSGEYILNHDSDDFFEPDFISKSVEILEGNEHVRIVTCYANRIYQNKVVDIFKPTGGNFENFMFYNAALGSAMFKKKDWENVGGYEEVLPVRGFEDWELYLNILKKGGIAFVIEEVLFNYRLRENSTTRNIAHLRNEKFKHILLKHMDLYIVRFEETIEQLFRRMEKEQQQYLKVKEGLDYKIGSSILKPVRYLKRNL
jgi:glycosyltransferase involved in cell wall biosynthesis